MKRMNENTVERQAGTGRSSLFGKWASVALAVLGFGLVVGCVVAWRTSYVMSDMPSVQRGSAAAVAQRTLVDETPWVTARSLAGLAVTQEELTLAREAERLGDHDVDQAFAAALRKANLKQKALTGEALELQQRVTELEATVASDEAQVKGLGGSGGDDLAVAQAQLGLDQDELTDARADLARASGDQRGEIQQELAARQADMKKYDAAQGTGEVATVAATRYRTLTGLIGAWRKQRTRRSLLVGAKAAAERCAASFAQEHDALEIAAKKQKANGGAAAVAVDKLAGLKAMSLQRQLMSIYDDRVDTEKQLAATYDKWAVQVGLQHRIVVRMILVQTIWVVVILLVAIVLVALVRRLAERESVDARRVRTLSRIGRLAIQVIALLSILLVMFGPPQQLSTVIGLITAGLTVALQDFILAFVGWFVLMGRSGVGIGDVIEIDSVTGKVVEIGLFRTTLLETGNWTANGHPTGRRVAFNNKYAISGKYFNFSTAGQWMWDELTVTVPASEDTYATIERVHDAVASATRSDAKQAEREWRLASTSHGLEDFSAGPAVNLRPSASGVELVVRYVTQASSRFEKRDELYQAVLEAMQGTKVG